MKEIVPMKQDGMLQFGLTEAQLHKHIKTKPEVLGFGIPDLECIGSELSSGRGKLDLLLQSTSRAERYAVEIQRGEPDGDHIVRAIKYWESEQKRSEGYRCYAVIVAENIVQGRFFSVLALLQSHGIPIIAIEAAAVKLPNEVAMVKLPKGKYGVAFTRVLDCDEDVFTGGKLAEVNDLQEPVTEDTWRKTYGNGTVELMKKFCHQLGVEFYIIDSGHYAGMIDSRTKKGKTSKCQIWARTKGDTFWATFQIPKSSEMDDTIRRFGGLSPDWKRGYYRFPINNDADVKKYADLWRKLYREAAGIADDGGGKE